MNFNFDKELLRSSKHRILPGLSNLVKPVQKRGQVEDAMKLFNFTDVQDIKDFLQPEIYIPKMDPAFVPAYIKMIKMREKFQEPNHYPIYMKTVSHRMWYRYTWTITLMLSMTAFYHGYLVLKNVS